jgi:hypothetical protein
MLSISVPADRPVLVNNRHQKWAFDMTWLPLLKKSVKKIRSRRPRFYSLSGGYHTANTRSSEVRVSTESKALDWLRFRNLVAQWREERGATSSIAEMSACSAYLRIMAMGKEALPHLIAQLRLEGDEPDHWFVALHYITGVDPVPDEHKGDMPMMAKAWLDWADAEGDAW